jgi:hypothetical protein
MTRSAVLRRRAAAQVTRDAEVEGIEGPEHVPICDGMEGQKPLGDVVL